MRNPDNKNEKRTTSATSYLIDTVGWVLIAAASTTVLKNVPQSVRDKFAGLVGAAAERVDGYRRNFRTSATVVDQKSNNVPAPDDNPEVVVDGRLAIALEQQLPAAVPQVIVPASQPKTKSCLSRFFCCRRKPDGKLDDKHVVVQQPPRPH